MKRVIVTLNGNKLKYPFKIQELGMDNSIEEEYEVKPGFAAIDCINCGDETPLGEAVVDHDKQDGWTHVETTDQIERNSTKGHHYWKPEELDVYCSKECAVTDQL